MKGRQDWSWADSHCSNPCASSCCYGCRLQYVNWITVGDLVPPQSLSASKREALAKNLSQWQLDKLPSKMAQIDRLLDEAYPTGTALFYVHCEAGTGLTGHVYAVACLLLPTCMHAPTDFLACRHGPHGRDVRQLLHALAQLHL